MELKSKQPEVMTSQPRLTADQAIADKRIPEPSDDVERMTQRFRFPCGTRMITDGDRSVLLAKD